MLYKKYFFLIIIFGVFSTCYSQEIVDTNKLKISSILENYFDLEREVIHLHLNKTSFLTNESIWFQGYIINRKNHKPFFTTNVFVVLYDENGTQLSEKLIYANSGVFSGNIDLKSTYHSGNFYIQAYTNWMNNFSEDESIISKVNIINPNEGIKNYSKINEETLGIYLNPEGKSFLKNVYNTIGIQFKDCRNNSPENIEGFLQNDKGEVLKSFKLDKFGLGKINILPSDENQKIVVSYNNKKYEKELPAIDKIGFALEVNDFSINEKSIIKIKTNKETLNLIASKKYYLIVHQDEKYLIYDLLFNDELEQIIYLNNKDLSEGVNTIRIIDSDLKEWSQRLMYIYPKIEKGINFVTNDKKNGKINLAGYSNFLNSNLSISVLPDETKSLDENNTIFEGLTINPYLIEPIKNCNYYFNAIDRTKCYGLDLALLNQTNQKYEWSNMKLNPPKTNYSFDIGLSLKGKINPAISNKTYHKVKLVSFKDLIMMQSEITEKGDYLFEHILLADSTYVRMSLQKLPNFEEINNTFSPQLLNRKKPFYKPLRIKIGKNCPEVKTDEFLTDFDLPKFDSNVIALKEVKIITEKKKLTYENKLGNGNLRGYKVDEKMERQSLLNFIESNGFTVERNLGSVKVYSRLRTTLNSARATPLISIDERAIVDQDELSMMQMSEVDEIYLNPHAIVPSMNNYEGIIKIYTKKIINTKQYQKQNKNSFYIKEGFAQIKNFKNVDYQNTQSQGFDNYGVIGWSPRKYTDENGQFLFDVTNYNKSAAKIIIQGMTNDGQLIQDEISIDLK